MAVIVALPMICSVVSDQGIMNAGLRHCCNLFLCVARSPSPPFGFLRIFDHALWSQRRVVNNSNINMHAHAHEEGPCRHHAVFALLLLNATLMCCWWEDSCAAILRCAASIWRLLSAMTRPCTVFCRCSSACMRIAVRRNNS